MAEEMSIQQYIQTFRKRRVCDRYVCLSVSIDPDAQQDRRAE